MTYADLKTLTTSLLFGDTKIPDDTGFKPLLGLAYIEICNKCVPLKLTTNSKDFSILRQVGDGVYLRKAKLPVNDADTLDIDDELGFAVAYYIASFLSKIKPPYFEQKAIELITSYNYKIMEAQTILKDVNADC